MLKTLFILIIAFLLIIQFVNPTTLKQLDFSIVLTKVEVGLNELLKICEKIDYYIFEPIKIKYIPGYVPKNPPGEEGENVEVETDQPTEAAANQSEVIEQFVKITLHTGFTAEGKLISLTEGRYTIEMDGYPVVFTESEIATVTYID